MTPKERAAMQQALEALEELHYSSGTVVAARMYESATAALREALDQPDCQCGDKCFPIFSGNTEYCETCGKPTELAEPVKQEPVAWAHPNGGYLSDKYIKEFATGLEKETHTIPLYAAPVGAEHFLKAIAALREGIATCRAEALAEHKCGGCAKTAADGWALYCVECWEKAEPVKQEPVAWQGAEEWEPLAFQLCADENGEESCNELLWDGGVIPEPWGERWLKYEDEAKRMIEYVRKYAAHVRTKDLTDEEAAAAAYKGFDDYWTKDCKGIEAEAWLASARAVIAADREKNK